MEPPVIIGDLKPQNIMVRPDGHIVLIDFGAASTESRYATGDGGRIPAAGEGGRRTPAAGACGIQEDFSFASAKWSAPERIRYGTADVRSDIYSLGRVLEYISGKDKPPGMTFIIRRCTMKDPKLRYGSVRAVIRDLAVIRNTGKLAAGILIFFAAALLSGAVSRGRAAAAGSGVSQIQKDDREGMDIYYHDEPEDEGGGSGGHYDETDGYSGCLLPGMQAGAGRFEADALRGEMLNYGKK
jgi:hypothetical protein